MKTFACLISAAVVIAVGSGYAMGQGHRGGTGGGGAGWQGGHGGSGAGFNRGGSGGGQWRGGSAGSGNWRGGNWGSGNWRGGGGNWRGGSSSNWRGGNWHGGSWRGGAYYHGGHWHGGWSYPYYYGFGFYPYYYPYYAAPSYPLYAEVAPPVYVERYPPPVYAEPPPPAYAEPPPPTPERLERFSLSARELFEFDRATLRMPQPKLDEIALVLSRNLQINNVRIIGYTDRIGTDSYNLKLSQRRADAVKSYLVGKGVSPTRLTAIGKGKADPVVQCPETAKAALIKCLEPNRRVVIEEITVERRVPASGK